MNQEHSGSRLVAETTHTETPMNEPQDIHVQLTEERLSVETAKVVDGRVRVSTRTEMVTETADAVLNTQTIEVTRHPIGQEVSSIQPSRTEGDVTILPVFEERLVIEKRLFLVEEVHIRKVKASDAIAVPVDLRKQKLTIEKTSNETKDTER
jgi:uncharacterized protein (TIGR02271 family)